MTASKNKVVEFGGFFFTYMDDGKDDVTNYILQFEKNPNCSIFLICFYVQKMAIP